MSAGSPTVHVATRTLTGRRPQNEDALLVAQLEDGRTLLAVADGMGGHAAGEVASRLALDAVREALADGEPLEAAYSLANERVRHAASQDQARQGMGTTLVAMVLASDGFRIANVGDSRAYRVAETEIRRLTRDHSYVAEAVRRGQSEEEARSSRWQEALTRSVGTGASVDVDLFGPFTAEAGTAVLLCSDGLVKSLDDTALHQCVVASSDTEEAAEALVSAAFDAGSDDNISVIVAEFGTVPRWRGEGVPPAPAVRQADPPAHPGGAPAEAGPRRELERPAGTPDAAPDPGHPGVARGPGRVVAAGIAVLVVLAALTLLLLLG